MLVVETGVGGTVAGRVEDQDVLLLVHERRHSRESDGQVCTAFPRRRPGRSLRPRRERSSSRLHRTGWRARGRSPAPHGRTRGRCPAQRRRRRHRPLRAVGPGACPAPPRHGAGRRRPAVPAPTPAQTSSRRRRAMQSSGSCPHSSSARLSRARPNRAKKDALAQGVDRGAAQPTCQKVQPLHDGAPCKSAPTLWIDPEWPSQAIDPSAPTERTPAALRIGQPAPGAIMPLSTNKPKATRGGRRFST